jgi:hypothetical protein
MRRLKAIPQCKRRNHVFNAKKKRRMPGEVANKLASQSKVYNFKVDKTLVD